MFLCRAVLGAGSGAWGLVELAATGRWSFFSPGHQRSFLISTIQHQFFLMVSWPWWHVVCDPLQDGLYRRRMGRRVSMADKVFGRRGAPRRVGFVVPVASSSICHRRRMDAASRASSFVNVYFFVVHSLLKCSNKLKFNFFVYHSGFRGGKREFSSIAGVDSPYHSLQVAAVTRLFVW